MNDRQKNPTENILRLMVHIQLLSELNWHRIQSKKFTQRIQQPILELRNLKKDLLLAYNSSTISICSFGIGSSEQDIMHLNVPSYRSLALPHPVPQQ